MTRLFLSQVRPSVITRISSMASPTSPQLPCTHPPPGKYIHTSHAYHLPSPPIKPHKHYCPFTYLLLQSDHRQITVLSLTFSSNHATETLLSFYLPSPPIIPQKHYCHFTYLLPQSDHRYITVLSLTFSPNQTTDTLLSFHLPSSVSS